MQSARVFAMIMGAWMLLSGGSRACGEIETWVIGEERSWGDSGTMVAMADSGGWIRPNRLDPETNILGAFYRANRLVAGAPDDYFGTREYALIWSPNVESGYMQTLLRLADGTGTGLKSGTSMTLLGGVKVSISGMGEVRLPEGTEVKLANQTILELTPNTTQKNIQATLLDPTAAMTDTLAFVFFNREKNKGVAIYMDLGEPLPLYRFRFFPLFLGELGERYMKGYQIYLNDGRPESLDRDGYPIYTEYRSEPNNREAIVDLSAPDPQYARYIKLRASAADPFILDQFELYGKGYMREATYTSHIIDLGAVANLGKIGWGEAKEPATSVSIQTRVGTDNTVMVYHERNVVGDEVPLDEGSDEANRTAWEHLAVAQQGSVNEDAEHWSLWSRPYLRSGLDVDAPGPRRYMQFRITLANTFATNKAQVDSLSIQYSRPALANELWGKITPRKGVSLGRSTRFRYVINPSISGNEGFDTVEIKTPVAASLEEVRIAGDPLPSTDYAVVGSDSLLTVSFPGHRIVVSDSLDLTFTCKILAYGTVFEGSVSASWLVGASLPQRISERRTDDLSVQGAEGSLGQVIGQFEIAPNPMTPNADGINDEAHISFTLLQIVGQVRVRTTVCDLLGRTVWTHRESLSMGPHTMSWNGENSGGTLVPPGMYVARIQVDGDEEEFVKVGTVAVVY
ncbi:MAG: gliding motility-associated C-terminal domain-containing protein [Candidatus Latescibacterota bacterium]